MTKELQKRKLISPKYVNLWVNPHSPCRKSFQCPHGPAKRTKRTMLIIRKHIHYSISKGPQFALEVKQLETDLTVEMLSSYVTFITYFLIKWSSRSKHHYPLCIGRTSRVPFTTSPSVVVHELTTSGAWKDASFKNYNFAAAGQLPEGGALHPLLKMREEMRQIFFDMGYVILSLSLFPFVPLWSYV